MSEEVLFKPSSMRQEQFLNSKAFITVFGGAAMSGKAQPLHSSVLTKNGWKTMGELTLEDVVITPKNKQSKILDIYEHKQKEIYKITTQSGNVVEACGEHLWNVTVSKYKCKSSKITCDTDEIIEYMNQGRHVYLPISEPVGATEDADLPLDPYFLGVLIAEGGLTTGNTIFTNLDKELVNRVDEYVSKFDYHLKQTVCGKTYAVRPNVKVNEINEKGQFVKTNLFNIKLDELGLSYTNSYTKFIPKDYLYKASINQRLGLLKGLMDSDGTIGENRTCEYATSSEQLKDDFCYLVRSLGGVAKVISRYPTYTHNGEKKTGALSYRIYVKMRDQKDMFFVSRKVKRCDPKLREISDEIVSIEYIGKQDARCIFIEDEDHLYLTDNFVVTHNTYQGLMRFLWYVDDPLFSGYVVRKNATDFKKGGGAFEEAVRMFKAYDPKMRYTKQPMQITFSSGATINFIGLDGDSGMDSIQGIQITCAMVDEATHLTEDEISWLITRLRATSEHIEPCVWLTCNPDPDSFLCEWLSDYYLYPMGTVVDGELVEGRPIPERNGDTRYFIRIGNELKWSSSYDEIFNTYKDLFPLDGDGNSTCVPQSFCFIGATCLDNPLMLKKNPNYVAQLASSPRVKMERLLKGNWYAREEESGYFKRSWTPLITEIDESKIKQRVRAFDLASSVPSEKYPCPDYTASVLLARTIDDQIIVEHVEQYHKRAGEVEEAVFDTIYEDMKRYGNYKAYLPQDPASAGQIARRHWSRLSMLKGIPIRFVKVTSLGGKLKAFEPFSSSAQNEMVSVLEDKEWNRIFFAELEAFDGKRSTNTKKDDIADACAMAFNQIATSKELPKLSASKLRCT